MPVKVYSKAHQQVVEVDAKEAQRGIQQGDYDATGTLRVAKGNRTGTVDAADLLTALGQGAELVDEEGSAQVEMRREEESLAGQIQGGAEAIAAGATLGLSSAALDALGADPERMRMRREVLGKGGTALELAGAAVPTFFTGGSSLAGRGLAATAMRSTPAAMLTRGAARLEGGLARMVGRETAAARILPAGARNFVEGAVQAGGAQLDENVLGDRELNADLLGAMSMGGLFGAGAGYGVQGLAAVASGTTRASIRGMQGVLGRLNSATGGTASREIAELAVREGQEALSPGAQAWMKSARLTGVGDDVAERLAAKGDTAAGREHIMRVEREMPRIQEDAARLLHERVPAVTGAMDEARRLAGGQSKARYWERLGPKGQQQQHVAARATDDLYLQSRGELERLAADNIDPRFPGAMKYHPGVLREADAAAAKWERELVEAEQLSGKSRSTAKAMATDNYKRALGEVIDGNGGWGKMRMATPEVRAANIELRRIYGQVRDHLEREDLWSGAAVAQRELNASYRNAADADDLFREAAAGSGLSTITNPDGTFNMQKALKLARAHGKLGGDVTVTRLTDALKARVKYFDDLARHVDSDEAFATAHRKIKADVDDIERQFKSLADDAGMADDLKALRDAQGNKSPSHTLLTTQGPALMGMMGFGLGGGIGGAIGTAIGAATQPHRTLLNYAQIRSMIDKADVKLSGAISGMFSKAKAIRAPEIRAPRLPVGVAGRAASSPAERQKKREVAIAKAVELSSSPDAVARAMSVPHYELQDVAPGLSGVMQQRAQNAAKFLQSKAPKAYTRGTTSLVDPLAEASFERYLDAVADPIGALAKFESGRITNETAEAIRVVYPALYADIQQRIQQELADAQAEGREIPYDRRIRLGGLFQSPTDPSLRPPIANEIQMAIGAAYDEPDAAQAMAGASKPGRAGHFDASDRKTQALLTPADRAGSWRSA
jgi:hypothetical protein